MNLVIKTKVDGYYLDVMERFDLSLFEALKPKGADMDIVEFTGSKKGDKVHIRFNKPIKAEWISLITDHGHDDKMAYFLDEGHVLPFPLKKWTHKHIVEKIDNHHSMIVDDITFGGSNIIMDILMWPGIFLGFYPRKKVYKKYFANLKSLSQS